MSKEEALKLELEIVYKTIIYWDEGGGKRSRRELARRIVDLYTTPPQRTWVGLESEEIRKAKHHIVDGAYHYSFKQGALWAEAKLKKENT